MPALIRNVMICACIIVLLAIEAGFAHAAENPATFSTERCPVVNTLTGRQDADHWFSPARQNADDHAPNQCNSCVDQGNLDQKTCGVWKLIHSAMCGSQHCSDAEGEFFSYPGLNIGLQHDLRFHDPARFKSADGENCRFILWALNPVIGIEDINARTRVNYWQLAYQASQSLVEPPFPDNLLAIAIQGPLNRGQHQLHLHIGTVSEEYRHAIDSLARKPEMTQTVVIGEYDFTARYVPNGTVGEPFTGANLFDVASEMIPGGEGSMPLYGILAAVARGGEGVFVLAAKKFERRDLNFRQPYACGFAPRPKAPGAASTAS